MFITNKQMVKLKENGHEFQKLRKRVQVLNSIKVYDLVQAPDPEPVVKLSIKDGDLWLLAKVDPDNLDMASGLWFHHNGINLISKFGSWSISALKARGAKCDPHFKPNRGIRDYS